jgi:transcriptional regulator with XRE-family HTH domain
LRSAGPTLRSLHTAEYSAYVGVLIDARRRVGITQQELAKRLRKPQSFVSKYERRERRLDVPEFIEVARAMGIDPPKLLAQIERAVGD